MTGIGASVGRGGVNRTEDVRTVQQLLAAHVSALGRPPLDVDGEYGENTRIAIRLYQKRVMGISNPDGRVDPGGRTWKSLNSGATVVPAQPAPGRSTSLSGGAWWDANQARFPNSSAIGDLAPSFRRKVAAFVQAMKDSGASVSITAGNRHEIRAYLMHYCWNVARGKVRPSAVPAKPGCDIEWDHGNDAGSRAAAKEMELRFGIVFEPSLTSNHIGGEAVDMTIRWTGTLRIADAGGTLHALGVPRNGGDNAGLHSVGRSYGVRKLVSDAPHWSLTGR
jgi:peptidoglycan hydrolase-like protein with peptidoglycan-binding domain